MAPTVFVRHVFLGVLRIVDQYVHPVQVVYPLVVVGAGDIGRVEFVVGDVGAGDAVFIDLGRTPTGVVDCLAYHLDAIAFVKFAFDALELGEDV